MTPAELEVAVNELEERVERLRAMYEQYFLGFEKIEPQTLRKDVDRRLWILRREQIRNTGQRFKLQQVVSRYNTYGMYWQRTLREIENGTYKRDLAKAVKRFGTEAMTIAAKRRLGRKGLKEAEAAEEERAKALQAERAARAASEVHDVEESTSPFRRADIPGLEEDVSKTTPGVAPPSPSSIAPPAVARVASRPRVPQVRIDLDEDDELFAGLDLSGGGAPPPPLPPSPAPPPARAPSRPNLPAPPPSVEASVPDSARPSQHPKLWTPIARPSSAPSIERPASSPSLASPAGPPRPASGAGAVPRPGSGNVVIPTPPSSRNVPTTPALATGPARPPSSATDVARPPSAPTATPKPSLPTPRAPEPLAARAPEPIGASPAPNPGTNPRGTTLPNPGTNPRGATLPRSGLAASSSLASSGGFQSGLASSSSLRGDGPVKPAPAPAPASTPKPAPAPPAAAAPPAPPPPRAAASSGADLSDGRIKEIYGKYVDARRQCNESTATITSDSLAKSLRESAAKLRQKHGGKAVDFDVVIKDGKAILKPVVRNGG